ncbi:MAG TPA: sugar phosphate nucleotidyltransferase [Gemmatimonadota bacterium]|nr:sugar phosphate nucleotidyltransferase [Gemmatimonadota bacterium]
MSPERTPSTEGAPGAGRGAPPGLDAMVFAAGLGTRLRPLTDRTPKALVEVEGEPALGRVVRRLWRHGADRIVVNAHPFADRVAAFLETLEAELAREAGGRGPRLLFSLEKEGPLETGGGLLRAAPFFRGDRPILLHNVDVLTDIHLGALAARHAGSDALATLAVQDRPSSRRLEFDDEGLLGREGERLREPRGEARARAFAGVQVVSPRLLPLLDTIGSPPAGAGRAAGPGPAFSIVDAYLELASRGHRIGARDVTAAWFEIGTPERLEAAREAVREGKVG